MRFFSKTSMGAKKSEINTIKLRLFTISTMRLSGALRSVAVHRHANKNLTDIKVSKELGVDFGGNAGFADYLITASIAWRF